MLAGGLALIIPALVVTLDQTRYLPTEGAREDRPVTEPPAVATPESPAAAPSSAPRRPPTPAAPRRAAERHLADAGHALHASGHAARRRRHRRNASQVRSQAKREPTAR